MKLANAQEISEFLRGFAEILTSKAVAADINFNTFGIQFIVPSHPRDLNFLVKFYNDIAAKQAQAEIDLAAALEAMLVEHDLFGIDASKLDSNLFDFFRQYELVNEQDLHSEETLDASIKELEKALARIKSYNPAFTEAAQKVIESVRSEKLDDGYLNKESLLIEAITNTRKLMAPKLGEKNWNSLSARTADNESYVWGARAKALGNLVLSPLLMLLGLAIVVGSMVGLALGTAAAHAVIGPFALPILLGALIPVSCAVVGGVGLSAFGVRLGCKSSSQISRLGLMSSVNKEAANHTKHTEISIRNPSIIYNQ